MPLLIKIASIVFFIYTMLGCNSSTNVKDDSLILNVFSPEESKDLQTIHDFFTDEIKKKENCQSDSECYENYMQNLKKTSETGSWHSPIDRIQIDSLFDSFESQVFNEIWEWNEEYAGIKYLRINNFGKYGAFLDALGKQDESVKEYRDDLKRAGFISATVQASVLLLPEQYDMNDIRVQLVIAIHYITLYYKSN